MLKTSSRHATEYKHWIRRAHEDIVDASTTESPNHRYAMTRTAMEDLKAAKRHATASGLPQFNDMLEEIAYGLVGRSINMHALVEDDDKKPSLLLSPLAYYRWRSADRMKKAVLEFEDRIDSETTLTRYT